MTGGLWGFADPVIRVAPDPWIPGHVRNDGGG